MKKNNIKTLETFIVFKVSICIFAGSNSEVENDYEGNNFKKGWGNIFEIWI